MAKKKKNVIIKQGLDDWVMTYGDMMSLLLTFFVLIVSFSSMQETKFEQAVRSLHEAFGVLVSAESVLEFEQPLIPNHEPTDEEADVIYEVRNVEKFILEHGVEDQVEVEMQDGRIRFRVDSEFLFDSGRASLKSASETTLVALKNFFLKFPYEVTVEGHTDAIPINSLRFPSNWELSAGRSATLARFFQKEGMPPERISATGFGEYRPIATNATPEGREKNRRVEIFLQLEQENLKKNEKLPFADKPKPLFRKGAEADEPADEKVPLRPIINPVTDRLGGPVNLLPGQGAG